MPTVNVDDGGVYGSHEWEDEVIGEAGGDFLCIHVRPPSVLSSLQRRLYELTSSPPLPPLPPFPHVYAPSNLHTMILHTSSTRCGRSSQRPPSSSVQ